LQHDGSAYSDSSAKANIFNNYFASIFTEEDYSTVPTLNPQHLNDINPLTISTEGVAHLLQNIDPGKSGGPDGIPGRFLKELSFEIAPALTLIFETSIKQSILPEDWLKARVIPIHKKGSRSQPSNYRPVSLTCICCKTLEHILYSHIMSHLQHNNVLCNVQHGFRHKHSCETQLIETVDDFARTLNEGGQTDVIALDFSKAFDRVPHKRLLCKLENYGIQGPILHWIEYFLQNRTQQVVIKGQESSTVKVTSGVPQGTVLAPLLFLCYINDLPNQIKSTVRLYADDVLLYTTINSNADCVRLQNDLDLLDKWAIDWEMKFNFTKCEFLRISKRKHPILSTYSIGEYVIQEVTTIKYLGVTINSQLTWNDHIKTITKKANATKSFLHRNISSCPTKVKLSCYKSLVRPILEYASVIWAPHTASSIASIESIQRYSARFICNDYSRCSSVTEMLQSLSLPTLNQRRDTAKLIFMYKILHQMVDVTVPDCYLNPVSWNTRGHSLRFIQLQTSIDVYKHSFYPSTVRLWNALPNNVIEANSIEDFNRQLLS